jgi:hypothetical protein
MSRVSTRIGDNWLALTHLYNSIWRLQVWSDTPLEAEVTAVDETEVKSYAISHTLERLNIGSLPPRQRVASYWDSRKTV